MEGQSFQVITGDSLAVLATLADASVDSIVTDPPYGLGKPPGGLVLDPFTGSGSTGKAARIEGFRFLGIELSEEYATIARARIAAAEAQGDLFDTTIAEAT